MKLTHSIDTDINQFSMSSGDSEGTNERSGMREQREECGANDRAVQCQRTTKTMSQWPRTEYQTRGFHSHSTDCAAMGIMYIYLANGPLWPI